MILGLEKELAGMKVGQEKHVRVKPEDAYGQVNPKLFQEFSKEQVPPEILKEIKVGTMVPMRNQAGREFQLPVTEIKEKAIVINLNHPMAGKTLIFDVKVLDIQPGQAAQPAQSPQPAPSPQPK